MAQSEGGKGLIKMSELAKLSGVPAPTVKHYIREGLLPGPARRTSKNMAYYDASLADRVRVIKELQQAHFLPLKLIGDILEPAPSAAIRRTFDRATKEALGGLTRELLAARAVHAQQTAKAGTTKGLPRGAVLESLEISEDDLALMKELGLLDPVRGEDGEEWYEAVDLELMRVIDETRRKGLGDFFPMEILAPYRDAVLGLVRMELELFQRRVLDRDDQSSPPVQEIADQALVLGERLLVSLRARLLLNAARGLSTLSPPPAEKKPKRGSARRTR